LPGSSVYAFTMRVLLPLAEEGFDPAESAVPWRVLSDAGHEVVVATESGEAPRADEQMLRGLVFGRFGTSSEAKALYRQLERSPEFREPIRFDELDPAEFDALVLPGGHAPGMRQYLGNELLQAKVAEFFALERPVGAICHGVLIPARAGALAGRRTTCLPKHLERLGRIGLFWKGDYMRTYPTYVEDEVRAAGGRFERGPLVPGRQFVVVDGSYVSARWYGDVERFARTLVRVLERAPVAA
jgi:putative intracellular protease/amidase